MNDTITMRPSEAALRAELDALRAENARLREALEEAPEPACYSRSATHDRAGEPLDEDYAYWFRGTRREALDG